MAGTEDGAEGGAVQLRSEDALSPFYGGVDGLCPVCLEKMPTMTWRVKERAVMQCCGKFLCTKCSVQGHAHHDGLVDQLRQLRMSSGSGGGCSNCARREEQDLVGQVRAARACCNCRAQPPKSAKESFQRELKLAEKGHATAQLHVAAAYHGRDSEYGKCVPTNLVKAAKWYKKSADQGHPIAINMYGECLEEGWGVTKNQSESMKLYEKAVEIANFPQALHNLAMIYLDGKGVPQNPKEAIRYLTLAADQGYITSQYNLAVQYRDGTCGLQQDYDKAIELFTAAAEQGKVDAMHNLGHLIVVMAQESNEGGTIGTVGQCPWPRAMKWFRMAAAEGLAMARDQVTQMEYFYSSECANCGRPGSSDVGLLRCTKCKLMHYCSRKCQKVHWKKGHKKDCCEQDC